LAPTQYCHQCCLFFLKQRVQPVLHGDDADPEGAAESAAHRRVWSVVEHEERQGKVGIPESLPGNEAELREGARALQPGVCLCCLFLSMCSIGKKQWLAGCVFVCSEVATGRKRRTEGNKAEHCKVKEKVIAECCIVNFLGGSMD